MVVTLIFVQGGDYGGSVQVCKYRAVRYIYKKVEVLEWK
jgi:hypothetical protein